MEDIFIMCVFARLYCDVCDIYIKADRYTCEVGERKFREKITAKVWLSESHEFCFFLFLVQKKKKKETKREVEDFKIEREEEERETRNVFVKKKAEKRERETEECACVCAYVYIRLGHQTSSRIMHLTNRIK